MAQTTWQQQAILNILKEPKAINDIYDRLVAADSDSKTAIRNRVELLVRRGLIECREGKFKIV